MTKTQAVKYSLLNALLILLGAYIIFKVFWKNDGSGLLGLIGFCFISFGAILLSVSLTRIISNTKTDLNFATLSNPKKYQILKETIGLPKVKMINTMYASLTVMIFASTVYGVYNYVNEYKNNQLKDFGQFQKVRINDIHRTTKGGPYVSFEFYFNDKKFKHRLSRNNYNIGDSARIIFSTNNPDIVIWAEDFK
jgi:hypothetical protein